MLGELFLYTFLIKNVAYSYLKVLLDIANLNLVNNDKKVGGGTTKK